MKSYKTDTGEYVGHYNLAGSFDVLKHIRETAEIDYSKVHLMNCRQMLAVIKSLRKENQGFRKAIEEITDQDIAETMPPKNPTNDDKSTHCPIPSST
jgi:methyl coenzyme M reductase gamma subunit